MQHTFYVGEGPTAKTIIDSACTRLEAFRDAAYAILPEGAMIFAKNGGIGPLIGFGVEKILTTEEQATLGVVYDSQQVNDEGYVSAYTPNKRSAKGKEFQRHIEAVNRHHTTFSKEVLCALKINRCCLDGYRMHSSIAWFRGEKLFISIPGGPGDKDDWGDNKFPEIPKWFRAPQGEESTAFLNIAWPGILPE